MSETHHRRMSIKLINVTLFLKPPLQWTYVHLRCVRFSKTYRNLKDPKENVYGVSRT